MTTRSLTNKLAATPRGVFCEALSGHGVQKRALLGERGIIAGSDAASDLVLDEATVSRRHARFELSARGVHVTDLGSRNGTWYLGARVNVALVPVDATLRLGRALVRFTLAEASDRPVHGLVGASPAMKQLRVHVHRLAQSPATVLIRGETGTGKEAVARALHALGPRAAGPFVVFEGASNPELLESQLFGHRRGAFTGASEPRIGAVEQADRGTLFLDEVGELSLAAQVRLLRVLESRTFTRLGDTTERSSDFRVLSATQHDLEQLVKARRFREDLFFRLAVVVLDVPPLRRREGDVRLLAEHFSARRRVTIDAATLEAWSAHGWPGNVRELQNAVEGYGHDAALPLGPAVARSREEALGNLDRALVVAALDAHGFDVAAAARRLGLSRSQVYRHMQRFGIAPKRRGKER